MAAKGLVCKTLYNQFYQGTVKSRLFLTKEVTTEPDLYPDIIRMQE